MYMSDDIIYLQMPKTGCSHITKLLIKHDGGAVVGKHQPLKDLAKKKGRVVAISCRNPWAWYVSVWAHGCLWRNGLQYRLTNNAIEDLKSGLKQRHPYFTLRAAAKIVVKGENPSLKAQFRELYSDSSSKENFRRWLSLILDDLNGEWPLPDLYSSSKMKTSVGLMTHSFIRMATNFKKWKSQGRHSASVEEARNFMHDENIIDRFIKTETIDQDVLELLAQVGKRFSLSDIVSNKKTNKSRHDDYRYYYDEALYLRVQQSDRLLIERFGYEFDSAARFREAGLP